MILFLYRSHSHAMSPRRLCVVTSTRRGPTLKVKVGGLKGLSPHVPQGGATSVPFESLGLWVKKGSQRRPKTSLGIPGKRKGWQSIGLESWSRSHGREGDFQGAEATGEAAQPTLAPRPGVQERELPEPHCPGHRAGPGPGLAEPRACRESPGHTLQTTRWPPCLAVWLLFWFAELCPFSLFRKSPA